MKKKLIQMVAGATMGVLRSIDRIFFGSVSPLSEAGLAGDPYEGYRIGRERGAILRSYSNRGWLVLGFEEAQMLFKDTRFSSDVRTNKFLSGIIRAASDGRSVSLLDEPTLLNQDPPDHTRLRKLVTHGFMHNYILSLEPRIESIVDKCLDDYDPLSGQYDIVKQLAEPLPAIVIAEMLGLPQEDLPRFQELSHRLLGLTVIGDDEKMREGSLANEQLVDYFKKIIEEKRKSPSQDLIGMLIGAEEEGDRLSSEEMYSTCILLLVAGHETTTRLIANGMYTLLQHRDQLEMLKKDKDLTPNAVEEMLRFEPPVQLMPRYVRENIEFCGKKMKKNQMVISIIGSANRDPLANENPDTFDITREKVAHVSFGHGIHLCLGLNLARLEAKVAINKLLERFPEMSLADQEINWTGTPLIRGVERLLIDVNELEKRATA